MTTRHDTRLADGRELFYFDATPGQDRSAPDRRELPPAQTSSQVRWDPLFHDYAVIAGHRQSRTYKPPADLCPLCPSRGTRYTEVPSSEYEVAVFENRFPSFSLHSTGTVPVAQNTPFRSGPGAGRCEVVCFSSDHDGSFAELTPAQARTVIDAWADRTSALSQIESVEYVFCFENRGEEIGVTLSHPHGQIYGYPFVPPRFARAAEAAGRHRDATGACLQCELLAAELTARVRIVSESEHWVSYVPFAARWPFEVRVVPRAHLPDLVTLSDEFRTDLAEHYVDVLRRLDGVADGPVPYVSGWQQAPVRRDRDSWHLAAEIFTVRRAEGKLKYLAGSESGAGVWINDINPEDAAGRLRAAAGRGAGDGLRG